MKLFQNELEEDISIMCPSSYAWYQWYYDSNLKLLLFLPDPQQMPTLAKTIWLKILRACELEDWMLCFSGKIAQGIVSHKMLLHPQGMKNLQDHYQADYIWYIGESQSWSSFEGMKTFMVTEGYLEWGKQAQIKKQIWLNWLNIKK